jgi:hypothetical protein
MLLESWVLSIGMARGCGNPVILPTQPKHNKVFPALLDKTCLTPVLSVVKSVSGLGPNEQ